MTETVRPDLGIGEFPIAGSHLDKILNNQVLVMDSLDPASPNTIVELPENLSKDEQKRLFDLIFGTLSNYHQFLSPGTGKELKGLSHKGELIMRVIGNSEKIREIYESSGNDMPEAVRLLLEKIKSLEDLVSIYYRLKDLSRLDSGNPQNVAEFIKQYPLVKADLSKMLELFSLSPDMKDGLIAVLKLFENVQKASEIFIVEYSGANLQLFDRARAADFKALMDGIKNMVSGILML
ncbi:MAG: hypothetical protein ACD_72C00187G0003 [uncultured bacterium]|nr:MAG: hypothetical protein ACD_72C00187G0003 [uncultured bacterium]